ncbi:MAG: hypothetical protein L7H04_05860 [Vulcanisaeta sp.]|nr:hypothetical protein [Vulcanisaeta sp.]
MDYGDYYIIEFFDKKYVVRKRSIERDVMNMLKDIPCYYRHAFLRVLSLRLRINVDEVVKGVTCQ